MTLLITYWTEHLDEKRRLILRAIANGIEKPIPALLAKAGVAISTKARDKRYATNGAADHHATNFCLFDALRVSFYMRELHRICVYPWPLEGSVSLSDILLRLSKYNHDSVSGGFLTDASFGLSEIEDGCVAGCACKVNFKGWVSYASQTANSMPQGFGLSQYRNTATAITDSGSGNGKQKREPED